MVSFDNFETRPSVFASIAEGSPVEIYSLYETYKTDDFEQKVYLSQGVYRDEEGNPWVLPVVRRIEQNISLDKSLYKEYLPSVGISSFCEAAVKFLLGKNSPAIFQQRAIGIQCLAGTGALRLGAEYLVKFLDKKVFYVSQPTWENHARIFLSAGFTEHRKYRYWHPEKHNLDIGGLLEDLENAPQESVIIFDMCSHNPTGIDPTHDEWKRIAEVMKKRRLFPFFDSAYQGFASGDINEDAYPVRKFVKMGMELFCAQSFSKSFGLYNERVGNLCIVIFNPSLVPAVKYQMAILTEAMYSCPSNLGARIVCYILNNTDVFNQWLSHIKVMVNRIVNIRKVMKDCLDNSETPGDWNHFVNGKGIYLYSGLSESQVAALLTKYHIYILKSGRITLAGINSSNIQYVANAISDCIKNNPSTPK